MARLYFDDNNMPIDSIIQLLSASDYGNTSIRLFSLGRHALAAGLQVLSVGKGDSVLVPDFICRDLLASINSLQANPLFYPVDRLLRPISLPESPRAKAVIAVNYFGFPQVLTPFRDYCSEQGSVLIEDNAHGFLSRDQNGTLLGSRGDIGIYSLRKTFALPDGAALLINKTNLVKAVPQALPCLDESLSVGFIIKQHLRKIQNASGIRVRSQGEQITRWLRRLRTGHTLPLPSPDAEYLIPGKPPILCASVKMLQKINMEREVERRRLLFHEFHQCLSHLNIEPLFHDLHHGVAPYGYPFRADATDANKAAKIALQRGFDCSYWPDLPTSVPFVVPDFHRKVWWVNFIC